VVNSLEYHRKVHKDEDREMTIYLKVTLVNLFLQNGVAEARIKYTEE
jgi:hypothetical protein